MNTNRQINTGTSLGLKGRPVSSLDEVRATSIDFDGSIFYFPDLTNSRIYTKQINMDGTASLKVYELSELPTSTIQSQVLDNLVTKQEFEQVINTLTAKILTMQQTSVESAQTTEQQMPKEYGF